MADFLDISICLQGKHYISTLSKYSLAGNIKTSNMISSVWIAGTRVALYPVRFSQILRVVSMFVYNGATINGNIDMGILTLNGERLASIGGVAQADASVIQVVNLTSAITLPPSVYYIGFVSDSGTATFMVAGGNAIARLLGKAQTTTGKYPIPATVIPVVGVSGGIVCCGLVTTEVV